VCACVCVCVLHCVRRGRPVCVRAQPRLLVGLRGGRGGGRTQVGVCMTQHAEVLSTPLFRFSLPRRARPSLPTMGAYAVRFASVLCVQRACHPLFFSLCPPVEGRVRVAGSRGETAGRECGRRRPPLIGRLRPLTHAHGVRGGPGRAAVPARRDSGLDIASGVGRTAR